MWDPPGPGIEPVTPAFAKQIPNQWTTREALFFADFFFFKYIEFHELSACFGD